MPVTLALVAGVSLGAMAKSEAQRGTPPQPAPPGQGLVGDPQIWTDHPYYPGEGALSTPRRIVETALATPRGGLVEDGTNRSALIKLFLWRAEHYTHGPTPMLYNLPGYTPDPAGTAVGRDKGGGAQMAHVDADGPTHRWARARHRDRARIRRSRRDVPHLGIGGHVPQARRRTDVRRRPDRPSPTSAWLAWPCPRSTRLTEQ
jgi:hypothetical protein